MIWPVEMTATASRPWRAWIRLKRSATRSRAESQSVSRQSSNVRSRTLGARPRPGAAKICACVSPLTQSFPRLTSAPPTPRVVTGLPLPSTPTSMEQPTEQ